ncbi:MAG: SUMF1/EgtB/PvdO family nonheme iron enzyme [Deltaproteobacteria bacterium]|nr:SUMF1/EgtB/PvdO family nonheme iron enzyme [Deltaproteobacteria bacterium]
MASGDSTSTAQTHSGGSAPGGPFDVFICFARPSGLPFARELRAALGGFGLRGFVDEQSTDLGVDWDDEVLAAHEAALVTVVVVSADTRRSVHQKSEIQRAMKWATQPGSAQRVVPWRCPGGPTEDRWPSGLSTFRAHLGGADEPVRAAAEIAAQLAVLLRRGPVAPPSPMLPGAAPQSVSPPVKSVGAPVRVAPVEAPPTRPVAGPPPSSEVPPWASAAGADHFGRWAEMDVSGAVQRFRWIKSGRFLMGSPAFDPWRYALEGPQHEVTLSHGYWMADTPVTQALYLAVMGENPSRFTSPPDLRRPVEQVSWDDAVHFTRRLAALRPSGALDDGLVFQLPSEAQWEHACRAGTTTPTYAPAGKGLDHIAWTTSNAKHSTHRVGQLLPNAWGLFDTLGNVWEWCADARRSWDEPYPGGPRVDPLGRAGPFRALRGGSWINTALPARAAYRDARDPSERNGGLGLRLSRGRAHQRPASSDP